MFNWTLDIMNSRQSFWQSWVGSEVVYDLGDEGSNPAVGSPPCERNYKPHMLLYKETNTVKNAIKKQAL